MMAVESRVLSFSGTLEQQPSPATPATADEPASDLITALTRFFQGIGRMDAVLDVFRAAELVVEYTDDSGGPAVTAITRDELSWIPVCSTLESFAGWLQYCGRGAETARYGLISGTELLDTCLPEFPAGTGLLLDPGTERALALPPVTGIVAPALAVDRPETDE